MTTQIALQRQTTASLATIISFTTHPVVIGTLGLSEVILTTLDNRNDQIFYLFLLVLLTFVPAALYLFVHFKGNVIEMLDLIHREARLIPYILMIIGAIIAVTVLVQIEAPRPLFIMTLVLLANEIVLGTVNFWTKVSIHTATATFTAITLGYLLDPAWYGLIVLVPFIGWARVYGQRHSLNQVIAGPVFASIITVVVIVLSHLYL